MGSPIDEPSFGGRKDEESAPLLAQGNTSISTGEPTPVLPVPARPTPVMPQGYPAPVERRPFVPSHASNPHMYHRMKFYNKLSLSGAGDLLQVPAHVLPPNLFIIGGDEGSKQSSLQTIFSLWTTMMGSSILAMPWAFMTSGWGASLGLVFLIGVITYYTAYLILRHSDGYDDFSDVCRKFLGPVGYWSASISSVLVLVGAMMVMVVIMSTALGQAGDALREGIGGSFEAHTAWWSSKYVPPVIVACLLFPLLILKSIALVVKINSFGVISLIYMIFFLLYTNLRKPLQPLAELNPGSLQATYLAGILIVSFFVHNLVLSIMRNQARPENNARDLGIAFALVAVSYGAIGFICYVAFDGPLDKFPQNILSSYSELNGMAIVGRILLFFQIGVVVPIVCYVVRLSIFGVLYQDAYPSVPLVVVFNLVTLVICTLVGIFYPNIGTLLRFVGPVCGLVYQIVLPILVHLKVCRDEGKLHVGSIVFHGFLLAFGLAILVCQFVIPA